MQAQVGLLIILLAAMVDFVIGSFIGPLDPVELSRGFVGYNSEFSVLDLEIIHIYIYSSSHIRRSLLMKLNNCSLIKLTANYYMECICL
jgi:hypothetical protein